MITLCRTLPPRLPGRVIRSVARLAYLGAAASVLMVQGCVSVPPELLASYTDSFAQARDAGISLYSDYGERVLPAARRESGARAGGDAREPLVPRFNEEVPQPQALGRGTRAPDPARTDELTVELRIQALQVIDDYNQALTALATGASFQEMQASAGRLSAGFAVVGGKITELAFLQSAEVGGGFGRVAELLSAAADRQKLEQALLMEVTRPGGLDRICDDDGGGEAPAPGAQLATDHAAMILIDLLDADTVCMYRTARAVHQGEYRRATARIDATEDAAAMAVAIADARESVAAARRYAATIEEYRSLLAQARAGLVAVRAHAAAGPAGLSAEQRLATIRRLHASLRGTVTALSTRAATVRAGLPR